MSSEYRFWNRDSLYEEVWATPMAKLAQKYARESLPKARDPTSRPRLLGEERCGPGGGEASASQLQRALSPYDAEAKTGSAPDRVLHDIR